MTARILFVDDEADLEPLILQKFRKQIRGISADGMNMMMSYWWPGNVRELKNAVERAMILADNERIEVEHLPIRSAQPNVTHPFPRADSTDVVRLPPQGAGLEDIEKRLVQQALQYTQGNKTRASKLLRISRDTLRYKVKKHQLV